MFVLDLHWFLCKSGEFMSVISSAGVTSLISNWCPKSYMEIYKSIWFFLSLLVITKLQLFFHQCRPDKQICSLLRSLCCTQTTPPSRCALWDWTPPETGWSKRSSWELADEVTHRTSGRIEERLPPSLQSNSILWKPNSEPVSAERIRCTCTCMCTVWYLRLDLILFLRLCQNLNSIIYK